MKKNDIEKVASQIADIYERDGENAAAEIDKLTFHNSILVYIADDSGNLIYSSDEHGSGGGPNFPNQFGGGRGNNSDLFGSEGTPNNLPSDFQGGQFGGYRPLPSDFDEFLSKLGQSADGKISYIVTRGNFNGKSLICGVKLSGAILYISSPLMPMDGTTEILRTQLIYVTLASLFLALILAFFIARKFSRPLSKISNQAEKLGTAEYIPGQGKGFCSEIDNLADTLDKSSVELSKVEALRKELIANVSHDLRTPLTMIKAYSDMIVDISGDDREKREEHLKVISSETDRLAELVNDMLDLSVIEAGAAVPNMENVCISDLAIDVIKRFAPITLKDGIEITQNIEPDQYVPADPRRLLQVLFNLIGNAVNHADKIEVSLFDKGEKIRLEVKDNGAGIAEEELPYIWDRYYKAKDQSRAKSGTGLGLSIVKGILESHGAKYGVSSALGQGSVFWFEMRK